MRRSVMKHCLLHMTWPSHSWKHGHPTHENMDIPLMNTLPSHSWIGHHIYEDMVIPLMKTWPPHSWRHRHPTYEDMANPLMKTWPSYSWRHDHPIHEDMATHPTRGDIATPLMNSQQLWLLAWDLHSVKPTGSVNNPAGCTNWTQWVKKSRDRVGWEERS